MTEANEKVEDEVAYEKKWYIIHTYSGYEKKVAADLEKRIESLDLTDRVFRILVPEEEVLEEKRGKMVKVPRKLFPSYVMIEMLSVREENELGLGYRVDSDAWYVIRNTNGVTGFVGVGSDPIPLSDEEATDLLSKIGIDIDGEEKAPRLDINFKVGEVVTVKGTRAVKGGLSVEFEGLRGFIPASMLDTRFVRNTERFVGQEFEAKIKEVDPKENRFILSRREVVEEKAAAARAEVFSKLAVGDIVTGKVARITSFGAFIDLGGGIGVAYKPEQTPVDYKVLSAGVKAAYDRLITGTGHSPIQLAYECGRMVTGPYGYLVATAIHKKDIYKHYIGLDACMSNLMRPALYGSYHHITVMGKENEPANMTYDVTGSLCENNDKFAIDRQLPKIDMGDRIVIHDAGAHGHAMGFNYNGKLRSAELLLHEDGSVTQIRRAETLDDYFATLDFSNL